MVEFLDKIRAAFKNPILVDGKMFNLTISMGVAICPEHGITRSELIKKADIALYRSKDTGKLKGYEALIMWYYSELGHVSPYELITIAEELGLIVDIGDWIIEEALLFIKKVNQNRVNNLVISINISAVQLLSKDFAARLMIITKAVGVSPEEICLEMTETILIDSFKRSGFSVI